MRDASCVQRGEAVSKHAPAANPFGVCRYCPLPVLHGSTSGQIPSPRLLPPSARQRASVRSSQRSSASLPCGTQHITSGSETSAQVSTAQTPTPLSTPPSAAHCEAVRSSHSLSPWSGSVRQHITSGFGAGTSAQVSTSQMLPADLTTPPPATQSAALRSSHSISSPAAFGRQQTPCPVDGGTSPQGFGEQVPGPLLNPPS